MLLGFVVLLAGVATRVYFSDVLLAGGWFNDLDWTWVDEADEQRRGAVLMGIAAVVLAPLMLLVRAKPTDRHVELAGAPSGPVDVGKAGATGRGRTTEQSVPAR